MDVEDFIKRWSGLEGGAERANYSLFLTELCDVIGAPRPDPASAVTEHNDYVFERFVRRRDGTTGRIDLYRRNAFVLEAKQSRQIIGGDKFIEGRQPGLPLGVTGQEVSKGPAARRGFDVLMINARRQAEDYARELPQDHGWPPFVIVCDVGHCLEIYADFGRMGKYEQFPDRQGYRVFLDDLRKPEVRQRLHDIWLDPHALDPAKRAARATREIATRLAQVSKRLEDKHNPEEVAHFLMRCLFTMFAEDTGLLPEESFLGLLDECAEHPDGFAPLLADLWRNMDVGGYATSIRAAVKRFNGSLFKDAKVIPLGREDISELRAAAAQNWREVEPAIFGTLLEQALDPKERQRLGAHYTPRAYVERLVTVTVIEPLRDDWTAVVNAVEEARASSDREGAIRLVRAFHDKLCAVRVLDPACGTGNFLYVALDLIKRLEGEVLELLADLGGEEALTGLETHTVYPNQFIGLELNPRAAAIAELVLWIGYLQLQFKTRGGPPSEPILRAFGNINFGKSGGYDAVLTWDGYPVPAVVREGSGPREAYPDARCPAWPTAEFIVGNPPFLGKGTIREALGDGYVDALRKTHLGVNASADFVMFWWDTAAELLVRKGSALRRFGFVTTNSITQDFSQRVLRKWIDGKDHPVSIDLAIPDHPWTKGTKAPAAVRIAMTVVSKGRHAGRLQEVIEEGELDTDQPIVVLSERRGVINPSLTLGSDPFSAGPLRSNAHLASMGPALGGRGFILSARERGHILETAPESEGVLRPFMSGTDIIDGDRRLYLIVLRHFKTATELRAAYPVVYQHLKETVYPTRQQNRDRRLRDEWWKFRRNNDEYFSAVRGLDRYLVTVETTKHRFFSFVPGSTVIEHGVVAIGSADAEMLAMLSSKVHLTWALTTGGTLEDRPRYNKLFCFDRFPFPEAGEALRVRLGDAGEQLDAFRRARQQEHPDLSLTDLYNVREAIRSCRELTSNEELT